MKPAPPVTSRFTRKPSALVLLSRSRHARSPSRQCGSCGAPARSLRSTEYAGRGAGRPSSAVVIRRTTAVEPASSKIASANSAHVQSPSAATCQTPSRQPETSRVAAARCPVYVGEPRWSSTTATSSRSAPSRSIVRTKLCPVQPKSHDERTIQPRSDLAAPPRASTVRMPTAALGSSDSTYGSRFEPSKT